MRYLLSVTVFLLLLLSGLAALAEAEREAPDSPLVSRAKAHLKTFNSKRNKLENEAYRETALALADSLEAADELLLATQCLERVGIIHYYAGEIEPAISAWDRGLGVARRSGDLKRIGALLNAKAIGISASGENEKALEVQQELLAVRREAEDLRGEGSTWHNIAYSQLALFQYPEAVASLRKAIVIHREVGNTHGLAVSYLSLAPQLDHYLRSEEALAIADSAVAASEAVDNPQFLGSALSARADMLHRQGRYDAALIDAEQAVSVLDEAGATRFLGAALNNQADILITLGRFNEALAGADRILDLVTENGDPADPLTTRAMIGRGLLHKGDFAAAEVRLTEAVADFHALRDTLPDPVSQANANYAAGAVTYLALAHIRQGEAEAAWRVIEENQGRVFRSEPAIDRPTVSLASFQQALGERQAAALVYGVSTVEGCPGFLITVDDIAAFEISGSGEVRRAQAKLLDILASGREPASLAETIGRLGEHLVGPVGARIPSDVGRLIVIPGNFAGLPFEALPYSSDESVGDRFAVSYSLSASAFVELEQRMTAGTGFFAMADPALGQIPTIGRWADRLRGEGSVPLPEARVEVERIAPGAGSTFVGSEATTAVFRREAPGAAVIHLATHAIVDPADPDASALILASAPGTPPVLKAVEIEVMNLSADLVCLSGCSTVGGYRVPGEGTFGLTRAFLVAGSRTVVASWWDVEDRAGRRFMELFYTGLRQGLDRDVAAQRARAAMAEDGFSPRDRLAFAVVGAVSGELIEVLGGNSATSRWRLILVIVVVLSAAGWVLFDLGRRRR